LTEKSAGRGPLAHTLRLRGGTAAPEAPFVIEHREALIYMLCEAAELAIMCQYLYAAFSLKQRLDEGGMSEAELAAVTRWRRQISHVATQEMLHLALVHNLMSAIGGAPHLGRPNLPAPANHYPPGVSLALLPFGEQALRHFMFLERPEGMELADADGFAAVGRARPVMETTDVVPRLQDFATVGHLYRSIEAGFARLAAKLGERRLFLGPPRAQATTATFSWPQLIAVTDLASAQRAIDEILEQGEGARGHWEDAHFGQFVAILDEYQALRTANPGFDPVRPVQVATVRPGERADDVPLITDPVTARCTDLFNTGYEVLLLALERYFAHTEETDDELATLANLTVALMFQVIKPLGDLITTLPAGPDHPGRTAGPSFELFYETDYLIPHRDAAWTMLDERLRAAETFAEQLRADADPRVADALAPVGPALLAMADTLAAHVLTGDTVDETAATPADETTPVVLPTGDEPVRFDKHIKALFRARDRRSMSFAFDLSDYDAVRTHAEAILARLRDGSMPCDGAWPMERVDVFARWVEAGSPR
jgi:ferritin-like protein